MGPQVRPMNFRKLAIKGSATPECSATLEVVDSVHKKF